MFKKAISLMGGMEQFVKKGQTVVVKPNIGFPRNRKLAPPQIRFSLKLSSIVVIRLEQKRFTYSTM